MEITLASIKLVSMNGYKSQWKIYPEDVVDIDGKQFVRLKASNGGLLHMVFEGNDLAPLEGRTVLKGCSLACSKGLNQMMMLRNKAQQMAATKTGKCSLFNPIEGDQGDGDGQWMSKSRSEIKEKRLAPTSINITVNMDDGDHEVEVLAPRHPMDALWVVYDEATVGYVMKYLRDEGFSEPKKQKLLPRDISQSGDLFVGMHKDDENGKKKYRASKDLDDVIAWKALVSSGGQ
jgi:hypothetical protein